MRAFVIGGTGLVGRAISRRLLAAGWDVDVVARNPSTLPADFADTGVRVSPVDRADTAALAAAFGHGADLLVEWLTSTASFDDDAQLPTGFADDYFAGRFDYEREDAALACR